MQVYEGWPNWAHIRAQVALRLSQADISALWIFYILFIPVLCANVLSIMVYERSKDASCALVQHKVLAWGDLCVLLFSLCYVTLVALSDHSGVFTQRHCSRGFAQLLRDVEKVAQSLLVADEHVALLSCLASLWALRRPEGWSLRRRRLWALASAPLALLIALTAVFATLRGRVCQGQVTWQGCALLKANASISLAALRRNTACVNYRAPLGATLAYYAGTAGLALLLLLVSCLAHGLARRSHNSHQKGESVLLVTFACEALLALSSTTASGLLSVLHQRKDGVGPYVYYGSAEAWLGVSRQRLLPALRIILVLGTFGEVLSHFAFSALLSGSFRRGLRDLFPKSASKTQSDTDKALTLETVHDARRLPKRLQDPPPMLVEDVF